MLENLNLIQQLDIEIDYKAVSEIQLAQYQKARKEGFPPIILASQTSMKYWSRLEKYFPEFQFFRITNDGELIGFMNTVPFHFDKPLNELPDDGWDWMLGKGIADYEKGLAPNYLGGLQVIIRSQFLGKGYSKKILMQAKKMVQNISLNKLIIPIRPTKKHEYPKMSMSDYMQLKEQDRIYDPWIRTHLNSGAEIIKVCENSMNIQGDIKLWEKLSNQTITESGEYFVKGALAPVFVDFEKDLGEYREPNIWISYDGV